MPQSPIQAASKDGNCNVPLRQDTAIKVAQGWAEGSEASTDLHRFCRYQRLATSLAHYASDTTDTHTVCKRWVYGDLQILNCGLPQKLIKPPRHVLYS